MEAVPAAVALDGQKQRFDLGVFVGDLPLDDDVARSGHELDPPYCQIPTYVPLLNLRAAASCWLVWQ
jgi:hypothetical protein